MLNLSCAYYTGLKYMYIVHVQCMYMYIAMLDWAKQARTYFFLSSESEKDSTALMLAALKGDEIIVDILVACVSELL